MKLTCNTQDLAQELRLLNKVVPSKAMIPVLSHVLLTATDTLRLSATDLEVALVTSCDATIVEPGTITLPAKKLLEIIEQLPNAEVTITQDRISCGTFKSRLQTLDATEFPPLPEAEGSIATLSGASLRRLIDSTSYAVPETNQKYLLNGALLILTDNVMAMAATDSKRLSHASAPHSGGILESVTIPTKTLDILTSFTSGEIEFSYSERHLFFVARNRLLISRMLEGKFPAYERVIPRDSDKEIIVSRSALTAALKRVCLVSEVNQAVYLTFDAGNMTLASSSAEVGDADEQLAVEYAGAPLKVCVQGRHVLDFLQAASEQTVTIKAKDDRSPLLLEDGENFLNVVLAMRV